MITEVMIGGVFNSIEICFCYNFAVVKLYVFTEVIEGIKFESVFLFELLCVECCDLE